MEGRQSEFMPCCLGSCPISTRCNLLIADQLFNRWFLGSRVQWSQFRGERFLCVVKEGRHHWDMSEKCFSSELRSEPVSPPSLMDVPLKWRLLCGTPQCSSVLKTNTFVSFLHSVIFFSPREGSMTVWWLLVINRRVTDWTSDEFLLSGPFVWLQCWDVDAARCCH